VLPACLLQAGGFNGIAAFADMSLYTDAVATQAPMVNAQNTRAALIGTLDLLTECRRMNRKYMNHHVTCGGKPS